MATLAAIYFSSVYPQLPETVAMHFNASGVADNYQPKSGFLDTLIAVTSAVAVLVFGVPAIIKILPAQLANLPNKQYWLSPERVADTQEFFSAWFAWFGCAVYFMAVFAFNYAVQFNLHPDNPPSPGRMIWMLSAFIAFTVFWVLRLPLHFARVPVSERQS